MNTPNPSIFESELSSILSMMRDEMDKSISFQLPLTIGQYRLERLVGRGGMGDVYEAQNIALSRKEAIKFVRSKLTLSPEAIQRFRKEIESTAKLTHPNIVTVHNAGEYEGCPYMVMEFLEGQTVHQYVHQKIEHHSPLTIKEAVDIIIQAARGLQYAHNKGFIHRDVKPGNLWITPDGTVKVLDLGLVMPMTHGTSDIQMVGTPDFMAPEQCKVSCELRVASCEKTTDKPSDVTTLEMPVEPSKNVYSHDNSTTLLYEVPQLKYPLHSSPQSDIYSLGCTFFYLLTGHVPFEGEEFSSSVEKMEAQRTRPLPLLSQFRKDIPSQFQTILNRMTAKDPKARYASMNDVIGALNYNSKTKVRPIAITSTVVLCVALGLGLYTWNSYNKNSQTVVTIDKTALESKPVQKEETVTKEETVPSVATKPKPDKTPSIQVTSDTMVVPAKKYPNAPLSNPQPLPIKSNQHHKYQVIAPIPENERIEVIGDTLCIETDVKPDNENPDPNKAQEIIFEANGSIEDIATSPSPVITEMEPFPVGKEAGEELVRVIDGVIFIFRWCPPGSFEMGNRKLTISEDATYEQILEIAKENDFLDEIEKYNSEYEQIDLNVKSMNSISDWQNRKRALLDKFRRDITTKLQEHHCCTLRETKLTHGFWMLDCEVSRKMWFTVMPDSSANAKLNLLDDSDIMPVRQVSWNDAQAFCKALSEQLKVDVQLPTEAQWEYACRAGIEESENDLTKQTISYEDGLGKPAPIRSKSPNAWGLYNMLGNVQEWCSDWFAVELDKNEQTDPVGPDHSTPYKSTPIPEAKVLRGGDYQLSTKNKSFASVRSYQNIDERFLTSGFRVCVPVK